MTLRWSPERELYIRFYQKWSSNFKWSRVSTKGFSTLSPLQSIYHWKSPWGSGEMVFNTTKDANRSTHYANVNGNGFFPNLDQWYCLESHFKYDTNGTNGLIEVWVNGVKRWNYPNIQVEDPPAQMTGLMLSGYWNCVKGPEKNYACDQPEDQHPLMYRWLDNFVVSKQRIGCLNPNAPTGLTVQ